MTSTRARAASSHAPTQPPRRRLSTAKKVILGLLVAAVLAVFAAIAFVVWTNAKIDRIPAEDLQSLQPTASGGVRNILIVGSDSRADLPDNFDHFGNFSGARTDVVMVAHVTPDGFAQLLSLPRDLKVQIPGEGTNRINAAYVFGGPDLLVQTIQNNYGIDINNYVEIDFAGFANVVDALGGVTMTFKYPARDTKSGFSVDAGTHKLNGIDALGYARSRSYQEYRDGSWVSVNGSDIGRTERQQELLLLLFEQAASPSKAFNLPGFVSTFADQITADVGLTPGVMVDLGRELLGLDSSEIQTMTLPVKVSNENGRSYVIPVQPEADDVLEAFRQAEPWALAAP
jgi:LCP family protein required for cell wall assembly